MFAYSLACPQYVIMSVYHVKIADLVPPSAMPPSMPPDGGAASRIFGKLHQRRVLGGRDGGAADRRALGEKPESLLLIISDLWLIPLTQVTATMGLAVDWKAAEHESNP
jgi:hypothetical protein